MGSPDGYILPEYFSRISSGSHLAERINHPHDASKRAAEGFTANPKPSRITVRIRNTRVYGEYSRFCRFHPCLENTRHSPTAFPRHFLQEYPGTSREYSCGVFPWVFFPRFRCDARERVFLDGAPPESEGNTGRNTRSQDTCRYHPSLDHRCGGSEIRISVKYSPGYGIGKTWLYETPSPKTPISQSSTSAILPEQRLRSFWKAIRRQSA